MAILKRAVLRSGGAKGKPIVRIGKRTLGLASNSLDLSLPTQPSKIADDIRAFSFLIHGEKKIGKTSLWAEEEGAFFLEWDPEQRALEIFQRQIPDWRHYLGYVGLLEAKAKEGKLPFRTAIVDGVDIMYGACFEYTCKRLGITHPHDEDDFGKSWRAIKDEFRNGFLRLMRIPGLAVRFICHSTWRETKSRHGIKVDKLVPTLTGQAEECLVGEVDCWAAYLYDGDERVLVIKGDEMTGAGHRIDKWFRTPDGRMVAEVPMGESAQEAYANLKRAFNNQQSFVTIEERDGVTQHATVKKGGIKIKKKR